MRKLIVLSVIIVIAAFLAKCSSLTSADPVEPSRPLPAFTGGFDNQVKWGQHLVTVSGCQDCHSPKKMTPMGPDIDSSVMFAGYIAGSPAMDVNRKELQGKGLAVTRDLTSWVGPWGVSYAANLTSDSTGIGLWKEEQFIRALREGKFKGLPDARPLLPPMPWQMYKNFTNDEIKAIFAYLKSTKPVKNIVPPPLPPATM